MDPYLYQRGRQVFGDSGQQILGEVELLHVLQRNKCSGVDFGNKIIPQRQALKRSNNQREAKFNTHLVSELPGSQKMKGKKKNEAQNVKSLFMPSAPTISVFQLEDFPPTLAERWRQM